MLLTEYFLQMDSSRLLLPVPQVYLRGKCEKLTATQYIIYEHKAHIITICQSIIFTHEYRILEESHHTNYVLSPSDRNIAITKMVIINDAVC